MKVKNNVLKLGAKKPKTLYDEEWGWAGGKILSNNLH